MKEIVLRKLGYADIGAVDHSESQYGWLSCQYYNQAGFIDICVVDNGRGFKKVYNNTSMYVQNDIDDIKMAFEGISTKGSRERGFGIPTSRQMSVEGLHGKFVLLTGKGFYNSGKIFTKDNHWPGTVIVIRVAKVADGTFRLIDYIN